MPETIAYYIATYALTAESVLTFSQILTLTYAATIAVTIGANDYMRRKMSASARKAYNASLQDRLQMVPMLDGSRSRVYGKVRNVDGVIFKATRGTNSEFYTLVVAVAGHQVEAIDRIWFNDLEVSLDGSGWVQTAPYTKTDSSHQTHNLSVTGGVASYTITGGIVTDSVQVYTEVGDSGNIQLAFTLSGSTVNISDASGYSGVATIAWQRDVVSSFARVQKYLGSSSQDISAEMVSRFPSLCTTSDKFQGIALLLVDLEYSQDAFPTGVPSITAEIRGARVYDPRTATTAYSANPALIARDWARDAHGGGLSTDQVDIDSIEVAANACDVNLAFTTPLGGTVTQDAYACGIVIPYGEDPQGWLEEIVESMAGKWGWAGGSLRVVAGHYRAPVATLTDEWVSSFEAIGIVATPPRSEMFNALRMTIADAAQDYVQVQAPPVVAAAYVTADGEEITREVTTAGITDATRAQYVASVLLRETRASLVCKLPCKFHAWPLELFDVIAVTLPTFGWSAKEFEVIGWQFNPGHGITLSLKEIDPDAFDIDASYEDLGYEDNTDLPDAWTVENITGFTLTSSPILQPDGTVEPRILAEWDALQYRHSQRGRIEVRFGPASTAESTWKTTSTTGDDTAHYLTPVDGGTVFLAKARSVNAMGCTGPWCAQQAVTVTGDTTLPGGVTGLAASVSGATVQFSWDEPDDTDYQFTELRRNSWLSPLETIRVAGTAKTWVAPDAGTHTWYARHRDTSGNYSFSSASVSVTTTAGVDGPVGSISKFIIATTTQPTDCYAQIRFNDDGTIDKRSGSGGFTASGNWYSPTTVGIGSSYRLRTSQRSGSTLTTGTLDTYQALSTARTFGYTETTNGAATKSGVFDIYIAPTADDDPVTTGSVTLEAIVEP